MEGPLYWSGLQSLDWTCLHLCSSSQDLVCGAEAQCHTLPHYTLLYLTFMPDRVLRTEYLIVTKVSPTAMWNSSMALFAGIMHVTDLYILK